MKLPDTYSELWPGRFLKADLLKGQKVTLTIKSIYIEDLVGDKNKAEPKVIISFVERALEYVCPKTNGFCLKKMFGNNPNDWIGHKVTWFGTTCKFGRDDVDCLRIWGSPDIAEDTPITVPQGRKKAWEAIMHKTATKGGFAAVPQQSTEHRNGLDPRIIAGLEILGWTVDDEKSYLERMKQFTPAHINADLNGLIEERDNAL